MIEMPYLLWDEVGNRVLLTGRAFDTPVAAITAARRITLPDGRKPHILDVDRMLVPRTNPQLLVQLNLLGDLYGPLGVVRAACEWYAEQASASTSESWVQDAARSALARHAEDLGSRRRSATRPVAGSAGAGVGEGPPARFSVGDGPASAAPPVNLPGAVAEGRWGPITVAVREAQLAAERVRKAVLGGRNGGVQ